MGTAKTFMLLAALTALFMAVGYLVGGVMGMIDPDERPVRELISGNHIHYLSQGVRNSRSGDLLVNTRNKETGHVRHNEQDRNRRPE